MAERVLPLADVGDRQSFADDQDRPAGSPQKPVHVVGDLLQRDWPLGQIDLQRQLPVRIGQAGGGRNESNLSAHRLQDEHGIGRTASGVLLVGELHRMCPIAGRAAVAGRVIDELEVAVADVVVDRFGHADGD